MMELKDSPYTLDEIKEKRKIKSFLCERNIKNLYHFTDIYNLDNILLNGIIAREFLNNQFIAYEYNDKMRLEKKLDYNCISIGFPNYKMFYKCRSNKPQASWCVIELDSKILYEKECLFCIENAASTNETRRNKNDKTGVDGLRRLYYDDFLREQLDITIDMPTNPQAEVLVYKEIETKYIKKIYFNNYDDNYNKYKNRITAEVNEKYFKYRSDYAYWQKG